MYVLERYYGDGSSDSLIGPFRTEAAARKWAAENYPTTPVVYPSCLNFGTRLEINTLVSPKR